MKYWFACILFLNSNLPPCCENTAGKSVSITRNYEKKKWNSFVREGQTGNCSLRHREPGATDDTRAGKAEASLSRATSHCRQARRAEQGPGGGSQVQPRVQIARKVCGDKTGSGQEATLWVGVWTNGPIARQRCGWAGDWRSSGRAPGLSWNGVLGPWAGCVGEGAWEACSGPLKSAGTDHEDIMYNSNAIKRNVHAIHLHPRLFMHIMYIATFCLQCSSHFCM